MESPGHSSGNLPTTLPFLFPGTQTNFYCPPSHKPLLNLHAVPKVRSASPSSVCISDFAQTGPNISKLEFSAGETKALYASSTTILGEACLRQVSSEPLDLRIDIESRPVWGLQATLGTYGVCGIRVLYLDGSRSPWLGSGEGQLFSTLECRDRMVLELHSDVSEKRWPGSPHPHPQPPPKTN